MSISKISDPLAQISVCVINKSILANLEFATPLCEGKPTFQKNGAHLVDEPGSRSDDGPFHKHDRGWGRRRMRYPASEKLESETSSAIGPRTMGEPPR